MSKRTQPYAVLEGQCTSPSICPLSGVKAGMVVCIEQLSASPEGITRPRDFGFCKGQKVRLYSRHFSVLRQVRYACLGSSKQLAESTLVQTPPASLAAA